MRTASRDARGAAYDQEPAAAAFDESGFVDLPWRLLPIADGRIYSKDLR